MPNGAETWLCATVGLPSRGALQRVATRGKTLLFSLLQALELLWSGRLAADAGLHVLFTELSP